MAPSTTATGFEPVATASAPEQSPESNAKVVGNAPAHEQKHYRDRLSYQDKWIGWDGPVWCNRYGRFENKEQAAEDDGYKSDSPIAHQDPESHTFHQCKLEGCTCRVPFEHRSYVKDIQRRIEPMTASLVALEHQVGMLVYHIVNDSKHALHEAFKHEDGKEGFQTHSVNGHQADGPMHAEHFDKHREPMPESIAKLEGKVYSLTHQLHVLERQNNELARNGQVGRSEHEYWQVPQ